ncbi:MAG: hypothetical protein R3244_00055 [Thermoanaerobaculia bacterium]|nr:hypothetical protein [Thermoanaerobaculia bacterium]
MRTRQTGTLVAALLLLLPLTACAPPEEEITAAENAVAEAEAAEAPTYAPEAWSEAMETLTAAKTEIETQKAKNFVTRSYKDARELLAQAEQKGRAAVTAAAEEKARATEAAREALDTARQGMEEIRTLLAELAECPRQPKGFKKDLELLAGQADAIEAELASAQQTFDDGDIYGATDAAAAVQEQIDGLTADLTSAKEKIGC